MTLRDYRPEDFSKLCEIDRLCFPRGIAYSAAEIALALKERGIIVVVGAVAGATGEKADERAVAFVLARQEDPSRGHIITIDVLPEFRRTGLGSALMAEAHRRLKELGVERVMLETSVENAPAIAFYKKLGYATLRRLSRYYLGKMDAYLMAKDL